MGHFYSRPKCEGAYLSYPHPFFAFVEDVNMHWPSNASLHLPPPQLLPVLLSIIYGHIHGFNFFLCESGCGWNQFDGEYF